MHAIGSFPVSTHNCGHQYRVGILLTFNNEMCSGRRHPNQLGCGVNHGSRS